MSNEMNEIAVLFADYLRDHHNSDRTVYQDCYMKDLYRIFHYGIRCDLHSEMHMDRLGDQISPSFDVKLIDLREFEDIRIIWNAWWYQQEFEPDVSTEKVLFSI